MNDEDIIRLYWERDESAIIETSRKYGKYCFSISFNILSNAEDAEECVNDTYTKVWDSIPPNRPSKFPAFIGRIVRNLSLNRYKLNVAEKRGGKNIPILMEEIGEIVSDRPGPEEEILKQELMRDINAFLEGLSAEKRVMFVRRYFYADDIKTIARRVGKSENNITKTILRIRSKLYDYLVERGYEL